MNTEDNLNPDFEQMKPVNSVNIQAGDEHLQDGEWRYRLISEVLVNYIFVLDVEQGGQLKLSWASENLLLETGRRPGEILTMDVWKNIIYADDIPRFLIFVNQMSTSLEKGEFECRSFHKDGHLRYIRIYARQKKDSIGKTSHIIGAVREITELKHAEQQLLKSEEKYRKLHSSMTDAFCSVNMKGEMQEFNESYLQMLGYSADEMIKLTYVDLTPEKWHAIEARIVEEEILPHGSSGIYEKEYRHKDGTIIPIELRTFLIRDDQGYPSAMWAIVRDISQRKLSEEKLKSALAEKETLLREVHHRVKNNLQTVMTLIALRSPEVEDEKAQRILLELQEQIRTISVIYQELFQNQRLSRVPMQSYLELLVSYLLKTFQGRNNLRVEVDCRNTVLDAELAMPCGLIVNELVTNALKYAFPPDFQERAYITVKLWKEGDLCTLEIADNGKGLPDSYDSGNPTSIGLHLVKLWAKNQMKGSLNIDNTNGTVFTINFRIGNNKNTA